MGGCDEWGVFAVCQCGSPRLSTYNIMNEWDGEDSFRQMDQDEQEHIETYEPELVGNVLVRSVVRLFNNTTQKTCFSITTTSHVDHTLKELRAQIVAQVGDPTQTWWMGHREIKAASGSCVSTRCFRVLFHPDREHILCASCQH